MRTRPQGRTGIQVSPYCLGTMMFGKIGNPDHDDCVRIIHRAIDAGINVIDTADVYAYSETEEIVGKALKGRRDDKGRPAPERRMAWVPRHMTDERTHDTVERFALLAEEAGIPLTHMAMAFTIAHPGVTAAIIGPRTMQHLDGLLAGAGTVLDDDLLDRIDEIVPPGADIGPLDVSYDPPPLTHAALRRRPATDRAAA
ncbi:aldo/keto reductase [Nonomuraea sp. NPDC050404]|uniref:aldo/keto reductase n=1 Tax=Nonomuraea sp. NPDC050404 TaxID=3155783 RepID=UPI0033C1CAA5